MALREVVMETIQGQCLVCGYIFTKQVSNAAEWVTPKSVISICPKENAIAGIKFTKN